MTKPGRETPVPDSFGAGRFDELRDLEGDLFEAGVWNASDRISEKEGLPAQYRMRHGSHYVDEWASGKAVRQVIRVPVQHIAEGQVMQPSLKSLIDSIAKYGVLQPLIVRRRRGRYELIAGARRLSAAKAAGLAEVPCLLYDVDDRQAQRMREATNLIYGDGDEGVTSENRLVLKHIFPLLGQSLQTIISCLGLLGGRSEYHRARVASDLIYSEVQRAWRLMWGAMLVGFTPRLILTDVDAASVVEEVFRVYDRESLLAGLNLDKSIYSPCRLKADRRLVSVAIRGAVDTILPLARSDRATTVVVRLTRHEPSGTVALLVSQDGVRPPRSAWDHWFDLRWGGRPGGIACGLGLLAAKRVAELHGGRLVIEPVESGGCRLTLCLPIHQHE